MCPELELPLPDMIDYVDFRVTFTINGQPYIQPADDPMINDTYQKLPMNLPTVSFSSITFNLDRVLEIWKLHFVEEILSYKLFYHLLLEFLFNLKLQSKNLKPFS